MPQIMLTDEQFQVYESATEPVEIRSPTGALVARVVGRLPHETPEFFEDLMRQTAEPAPRYSGADIQAMFRALEAEWERTGGFDEEYAVEFIERIDDKREAG
jgi:hypothetical protein